MSYPLFDKDEHWHKPEQAFLTDDHRTILRFAVEALMSGKGAVLVTLVEIRGGAARPLGAQMVVREDGRYCGFVSGGCVEAAAAFAQANETPRMALAPSRLLLGVPSNSIKVRSISV